jgi:hypothetical protein
MRLRLLFFALAFLGVAPVAHAAGTVDPNPGTLGGFTQDVADGPSATKTSVITNHTGGVVMLVSVSSPSNGFEVVGDQFSDCSMQVGLFDGESCAVRVRFDPSSPGTATSSVVVSTTGGDATVNLSGEGTVRALTATPSPVPSFGAQSVGAGPTATKEISVTPGAGSGPVTLSAAPTIAGLDASQFQLVAQTGDCSNGTRIEPQNNCTVHVAFDPNSFGDKSAQVNIQSDAPPINVDLTGTGIQAQLTRSPDTLTFTADVKVGPSAPQVATVTNAGSEAVPIGSVVISDPENFTQLTGGANDCTPSTTLAVGGTCELRIAFDPFTKGQKSASVTVNSSAPSISVVLNGTATLTALDVPGTLDFGALQVGAGETAIRSATVTNAGTEPVTLSGIRLKDRDTARFLLASGLAMDCAPGRTLAAGETCELRVMYAPQSDGTKVGTLTVGSSAGTSTLLLTAAGTPGLAIPAFRDRASRTQNRRLTVNVTPIGGVVSNIVVRVRSRTGTLLGTGVLTRAGSEHAVTVRLKSQLKPGRYVATASGRDLFADVVTSRPREFSLR